LLPVAGAAKQTHCLLEAFLEVGIAERDVILELGERGMQRLTRGRLEPLAQVQRRARNVHAHQRHAILRAGRLDERLGQVAGGL
jgi:hypothetical protein